MATFIFGPNSKLYWDQYDLSGDLREGSFEIGNEAQEKTVWGDTTRTYREGLDTISISASGFSQHDTDAVEEILSSALGTANSIITMGASVAGTEGDILYCAKGLATSFQPFGGSVGDLSGFAISAEGSGNWYRGKLMAAKAARSSSSTSTGLQLGTIAATKDMHASLHVFATTGSPTLDVVIESDDNSGFTTATTRLTFTQATAAGVEFLGPTAGPGGSDDYWRASWTFGGTGTITFAVVFGDGTIYG